MWNQTLVEIASGRLPTVGLQSRQNVKKTFKFHKLFFSLTFATVFCMVVYIPNNTQFTDVGPSLLLVRRCGTLYRNNCVILFTPPPSLVVYWRRFFFQSTSVYSALEADFSALMRYINSRFTYLLTYLHYHAENSRKCERKQELETFCCACRSKCWSKVV